MRLIPVRFSIFGDIGRFVSVLANAPTQQQFPTGTNAAAVTRDVHAKPLGETPTRDDPGDDQTMGKVQAAKQVVDIEPDRPIPPMEAESPTIRAPSRPLRFTNPIGRRTPST